MTVGQFDQVITDLMMPGKEGIETIIELRRTFPATKVIAMSGGPNSPLISSNLKAAQCLGAHATLLKPFTLEQLMTEVNQVLNQTGEPGKNPPGGSIPTA